MDTRLMWTPHYYGQFSLSLGKAHTFSLNLTCFIEAIQIVKATCRQLISAPRNDCHRRLNYYNNKIQQRLDKLKQLLPTTLLSTIQTIVDKRADMTVEQHRAKAK